MKQVKRDVYYNAGGYKNWKERVLENGEEGISKENSELLKNHIFDMEIGINISNKNKKGGRTCGRMNFQRKKLRQIMRYFENRGIKCITNVDEKSLLEWANGLYNGTIRRVDRKPYEAPIDFIRSFKSFWNWWIKYNKKKGVVIPDLVEDLSLEKRENKFVYLTKEQVFENIAPKMDNINVDYGVLIRFVFDSLIRCPTEASSVMVKDVYQKDGEVWVNIPKEISKSIGREVNLLYCGQTLLSYIKQKQLGPNDYLFDCIKNANCVRKFHKKLKEVVLILYGDKLSHPQAKRTYGEISGYDLRHSGAVHLRFLAHKNGRISLDAIRHRGGWSGFKMLNYYTKFLNLDGKISKEETLLQEDKTKLEIKVEEQGGEIKELKGFKKEVTIFLKSFMKIAKRNPDLMKEMIERDGGEELREVLPMS